MTAKTRYFLVGSSLTVAVGLCTGLVAYYSGALPLRAAAGPAELSYLPANTAAIAYADVHDILTSEFRQKLRAKLSGGSAQPGGSAAGRAGGPAGGRAGGPAVVKDELLSVTGIDLETDIDSVTAGFLGVPTSGPPAIVLMRGRFDAARIEAAAVQHGMAAQDYRGIHVLVMASPAPGATATNGVSAAVAFLEPSLIATGELSTVKQAIDAAATHNDVTRNRNMMTFVSQVERTGNAWVVGEFDAISKGAGTDAKGGSLSERYPQVNTIPPVQWFSVSAQIDRTVTGQLRAEARDDQSGEQLRTMINGALAAAKFMGSTGTPALDEALKNVQATGTGKTCEISFVFPPEMIDLLLGMMPGVARSLQ